MLDTLSFAKSHPIKELSNFVLDNQTKILPSFKKVLVLDLDETLIHCSLQKMQNTTAITKMTVKDYQITLYVSERPGLREFLEKMSKLYNLILFTSAIEEYALAVLKILDISHFFSKVLHREHCQRSKNVSKKDLSILGVPQSDVILVDDSIIHITYQPDNILLIEPYKGDPKDRELCLVGEFLQQLAKEEDVRPVMDRLIQFQDEIKYMNSSSSSMQRVEIANNYLETKFLEYQKARYMAASVSSNQKISEEDYADVNENLSELDLKKKISRATSPNKRLMNSLKRRACSGSQRLEVRKSVSNDDDSNSTKVTDFSPKKSRYIFDSYSDNTEKATMKPINDVKESRRTNPMLQSANGIISPQCAVEKLPVMTLKPQFLKLQKNTDLSND